jgi:hypothetical protein
MEKRQIEATRGRSVGAACLLEDRDSMTPGTPAASKLGAVRIGSG